MPEYLAPGVYVEEVSFRSKSIEGVPTATCGYAGMTRTGPVQYATTTLRGPSETEPRLITSFTEFERVYGGLEPLVIDGADRLPYLAHAARALFLNGGKRLYVSRVFASVGDPLDPDWGVATRSIAITGGGTATWRARWPGAFGNVFVRTEVVRTKNLAFEFQPADPRSAWGVQARSAKRGAVVEVIPAGPPPVGNAAVNPAQLHVVEELPGGRQEFRRGGVAQPVSAGAVIQLLTLRITVVVDPERTDAYGELGTSPHQTRHVGRILEKDHPEDENAVVWLEWDDVAGGPDGPAKLLTALQADTGGRLTGGHDGGLVSPNDLLGKPADLDHAEIKATGLEALGEIDDIAIVALPDGSTYDDDTQCVAAMDNLIAHARNERYRIAVVDGPAASSMSQIREFRGKFDSKYAALYHPWVEILDPLQRPAQGAPPRRLLLPPSGFVTGIYARSDVERGVWKAPANEVVAGLTRFEANINKGRQDVLNPEGINALRFFEGRGSRVWGARTMSSDPEWKYVNVRRLFIFLEHSIDKSTQWAVFEPNNARLWANVRHMVEDFLLVQWRDGALMGAKPEEAFFARCDRTTMTQNDLDNGRLIVLVGVAPVKPAEYVIFRIGQWTADASLT
jgi:phage tail sheath protein FI